MTPRTQERVLSLADRLMAVGINAEVDQYNNAPPEGWPLWCEPQIAAADFVLMVCTETYHRCVSGNEGRGKGLGVVWEGSPEQIPIPIEGSSRHVIDREDGYEGLLRRLTRQRKARRGHASVYGEGIRQVTWVVIEDVGSGEWASPESLRPVLVDSRRLISKGSGPLRCWRLA